MPRWQARFTIRSLMVTVAVAAGALALSRWLEWLVLALCGLNLVPVAMLWRMSRGFRRLAALGLAVAATAANMACAAPD
jgi:hypothetical protein